MSQPVVEDEQDLIICPNCGELVEGPEFCEKCIRPLGPYTNFDPIRRLQGEGFALRGGIRKAQNPIVLAAMWMICVPAIVPSLWFFRVEGQMGWTIDTLQQILYVTGAALYTLILLKATANFFRVRKSGPNEEAESP